MFALPTGILGAGFLEAVGRGKDEAAAGHEGSSDTAAEANARAESGEAVVCPHCGEELAGLSMHE